MRASVKKCHSLAWLVLFELDFFSDPAWSRRIPTHRERRGDFEDGKNHCDTQTFSTGNMHHPLFNTFPRPRKGSGVLLYLTNREALTMLCSVVKHTGSGQRTEFPTHYLPFSNQTLLLKRTSVSSACSRGLFSHKVRYNEANPY